jgi:predicted TIM-barrel fold metal-dependent hydrolase
MGTDVGKLGEHLFGGEGVSVAILNGLFHVSALMGEFEFAQALASAYNDWEIEQWLQRDSRLRGSIHVVAHDPAAAAREIDRVADNQQFVQVFLPTVTDRQYGDPQYRPIFEAAVRHNLVVAFHHGGHTRTALGFPRYFIEWHAMAAPQAAMNQLVSLICNGVFDKYPQLKVAFLETGVAWVPWFMWRVDQQYRELRIQVPWVKRLPSDYLRDNVRLSTQPMGDMRTADFVKLVEMTESDRMYMFSTDYPHYDADTAAQVLPGSLPEALRLRIRYKNALETYPRLLPG